MEIEYRKSIIHQSVGGEDMEIEVMLPDFGDEQEQSPIGIWGQRHKRYLKEHRKATYITLLTSGKLNTYLVEIDRRAQKRFERLIEQMKQAQGITEQLKAENALEWAGRLNNIRACAVEILNEEIIYA